jgi:aspartate-semialdehyde dehydrogenase
VLSLREDGWGEVRLLDQGSTRRRRTVRGESVPVRPLSAKAFDGVDVAIFDLPAEAAAEWIPVAVARGAVAIDNSGAFRGDVDVPLVAPEVNPDAARHRPRGIVATTGCASMAMLDALGALHTRFGLTELVVTCFDPAFLAGAPGVDRLYDELEVVAGDRDLGTVAGDVRRAVADKLGEDTSPFAGPLALNAVPWTGTEEPGGWSSRELAIRSEVRQVLDAPDLTVAATCVMVPVVTTQSLAVHATFAGPVDVADARQSLLKAPTVVVIDDPAHADFPTPVDVAGVEPAFVGRLRQSEDFPDTLEMFISADSLRQGAALASVRIAELIAADLHS